MNAQPTPQPGSWMPAYQDPVAGGYVYLCERCGQPLAGPHDQCPSAQHAADDRYGAARAVRSSDLARLAGAARAALGDRR